MSGSPIRRRAFQLDDKPEWIKKRLTTWHGIYGPLFDWRKEFPDTLGGRRWWISSDMVRAYWGTILSVDDSVGRLYEYLEKTGELDNTLFIFTSDNGLLERRARHGRQADRARAEHPHPAGGALSRRWSDRRSRR